MDEARPGRFLPGTAIAVGFAVVLGTHLLLCVHYGRHGAMGSDEGFYAVAARSVMEGKIPYRDFSYTQMPLLPYWNGAFMKVVGFSMKGQRALNALWATIGLVAIIAAIRQRTGRWEPGLAAAFCVSASPHWAALQTLGTTHGSAGMFLSLCAAVVISSLSHRKKVGLFAAAFAMAIGCRLLCAPPALVLLAALVIQAPGRRGRIVAVGVPIGVLLILNLPFFLASGNAIYDVWTYHLASTMDRRSIGNWIEWWQTAPAAILVLIAGLTTAVSQVRRRDWTVLALLIAGIAGVGLPMIPASGYGLYIAPALPLAAAAGTLAAWSLLRDRPSPFRHVVWLLPALVLYYDLPETVDHRAWDGVVELANHVRDDAPEGPVLTPLPIVAVEAGRDVLEGTEMGMFAAMGPGNRKLARRLRLTTLPDLAEAVKKRTPAAIVLMKGQSKWNFYWVNPTLRRQPQSASAALVRAISTNYERSFSNGYGVVWIREEPPCRAETSSDFWEENR